MPRRLHISPPFWLYHTKELGKMRIGSPTLVALKVYSTGVKIGTVYMPGTGHIIPI